MSRLCKIMSIALVVAGFLMLSQPVRAAEDQCFCYTDLSKVNVLKDNLGPDESNVRAGCQLVATNCENNSTVINQTIPEALYIRCDARLYSADDCRKKERAWITEKQALRQKKQDVSEAHGFIGRAIPPCVLRDELTRDCRDVSVFVELIINYANSSLSIIGAFALAFFIYGGFVLILSQGNPEKIKKGTDIMLATLIGLVIVFSAYLFIQFLGRAIGIKPEINLK